MRDRGERASRGRPGKTPHGAGITSLADLGISQDRASRAMKLADVPEREFEAALNGDRPIRFELHAVLPCGGASDGGGALEIFPKASQPGSTSPSSPPSTFASATMTAQSGTIPSLNHLLIA
jgi:hypothetical protein